MKMLLLEELLSIAPLTIPVGTLVKFHSSQIKSYSPPPVVHKFVKTKVFDLYSDKLRLDKLVYHGEWGVLIDL